MSLSWWDRNISLSYRLSNNAMLNDQDLIEVNRSYWLRAGPNIQRIKQNIRDARELLRSTLEWLGLHDR